MSGKAKSISEMLLDSARDGAFEIVQQMNEQKRIASIPGFPDLLLFAPAHQPGEEAAAQARMMADAQLFIDPKRSKSIHREMETDSAVEHITRTRATEQSVAPPVERAEFELI